jgi:hypothetical protein
VYGERVEDIARFITDDGIPAEDRVAIARAFVEAQRIGYPSFVKRLFHAARGVKPIMQRLKLMDDLDALDDAVERFLFWTRHDKADTEGLDTMQAQDTFGGMVRRAKYATGEGPVHDMLKEADAAGTVRVLGAGGDSNRLLGLCWYLQQHALSEPNQDEPAEEWRTAFYLTTSAIADVFGWSRDKAAGRMRMFMSRRYGGPWIVKVRRETRGRGALYRMYKNPYATAPERKP